MLSIQNLLPRRERRVFEPRHNSGGWYNLSIKRVKRLRVATARAALFSGVPSLIGRKDVVTRRILRMFLTHGDSRCLVYCEGSYVTGVILAALRYRVARPASASRINGGG